MKPFIQETPQGHYIRVSSNAVASTKAIQEWPLIAIDLDKDGVAVGIEILHVRLPKPKGHLYYVCAGQWFVCRALNARKARMMGVAEFGRGNILTVRRAIKAEIDEYLRWKNLPKDHVFPLEEPTS